MKCAFLIDRGGKVLARSRWAEGEPADFATLLASAKKRLASLSSDGLRRVVATREDAEHLDLDTAISLEIDSRGRIRAAVTDTKTKAPGGFAPGM